MRGGVPECNTQSFRSSNVQHTRAASGPVRLFTPYKRRRRNQITPDSTRNVQHSKQKKTTAEQDPESEEGDHHQQQMSNNSGGSVSVATKEEPNWQTITDGLDVVSNDYLNAATAAASTAALAAHVAQAQQQTAPTAGQCKRAHQRWPFWRANP